ncbi:MAG: adenylosuccinate lyase [Bacteroidia bacterium]
MPLTELNAISPIDGRYRSKAEPLAPFFSEQALIRYRLRVEVEYFIALCEMPLRQLQYFPKDKFEVLRNMYRSFSTADAERIKEIEAITNHDVKAVEYFLKEKFAAEDLSSCSEFIHFGLTSQDVNNTAIPMMLKEALENVLIPVLQNELLAKLKELAEEWKNIPMLARTHGQPASPTRLGKEIAVFAERLSEQLSLLQTLPHCCKMGGATGNFNAHTVAYPETDWPAFAEKFAREKLGLRRQPTTTQIEHYDNMAAIFDNLKRLNVILMDFSQDMWLYVSQDYFKQQIKETEVGSSAMPHKVNPIDFENAEGNLGLANSLLEFLARKLPVSRLQRDLTDSTVTRNIGVPLSHGLIAWKSLLKGLGKLTVHHEKINADLEANWAVVAEAIQTILRREGYDKPYEALKSLTRTGDKITKERIHEFIDTLKVDETIKQELLQITPFNYTGS